MKQITFMILIFFAGINIRLIASDDLATLIKKAEEGNAQAQHELGGLYLIGEKVPKNDEKGFELWTRAANQGHTRAQFELGFLYAEGQGVTPDKDKAELCFIKAAEQGDSDWQFRLAEMYARGEVVKQDVNKAITWYSKVAEKGNSEAMRSLGQIYFEGKVVPQDYKVAFKWFIKAAEQGNAIAQCDLSEMYYYGKGIPQDYIQAYAWANLAAAQVVKVPQKGKVFRSVVESYNKGLTSLRDSIAEKMSPDQLARAQELSQKLLKKIEAFKSNPKNGSLSSSKKDSIEVPPDTTGTGFFITPTGGLLTCYHVVKGGKTIRVRVGIKLYPAKIIAADKTNDIALLSVTGSFSAIAFSSAKSEKLGTSVFTLGYPNLGLQGDDIKFTKGEISSLTGVNNDPRLYQISIPLQTGNSGGAVLDETGAIVGIAVAKMNAMKVFFLTGDLPQNVNYAIKNSYVTAFLDSVPDLAEQLSSPIKRDRDASIEFAKKATALILVWGREDEDSP